MLIQKYLSLCPNPLNWNKQFWIKSRLTINESKTSWACAKRQLVFDFKTNSIFEFLSTQFHCITLYLDPNSELLWINIYRNLLFWNRFCSAKKVQTDLLLHCAERYPFCTSKTFAQKIDSNIYIIESIFQAQLLVLRRTEIVLRRTEIVLRRTKIVLRRTEIVLRRTEIVLRRT